MVFKRNETRRHIHSHTHIPFVTTVIVYYGVLHAYCVHRPTAYISGVFLRARYARTIARERYCTPETGWQKKGSDGDGLGATAAEGDDRVSQGWYRVRVCVCMRAPPTECCIFRILRCARRDRVFLYLSSLTKGWKENEGPTFRWKRNDLPEFIEFRVFFFFSIFVRSSWTVNHIPPERTETSTAKGICRFSLVRSTDKNPTVSDRVELLGDGDRKQHTPERRQEDQLRMFAVIIDLTAVCAIPTDRACAERRSPRCLPTVNEIGARRQWIQ